MLCEICGTDANVVFIGLSLCPQHHMVGVRFAHNRSTSVSLGFSSFELWQILREIHGDVDLLNRHDAPPRKP